MGFTSLDYLILIAYFFGVTALGARLGRRQQDTADYFLAGRDAPWWAVSISIVATETSTLTFIGAPAIAYASNLTFIQLVFGYVVGRIVVSILLIPAYFRGELQTAYQLLNFRFGAKVKNFASALFLITRSLADGVRLFATGLVLHVIIKSGTAELSSNRLAQAVQATGDIFPIIVIGAFTLYYTFKGGMRAVIWTDLIQAFIYIGGALLAFWIMLGKIPGGWGEIVSIARPAQKFAFLDFAFKISESYTFWSGVIGGTFLTAATHGTDQLMVQRYLACGSQRASQTALIVSGFVILAQFLLFLTIGVMLYAFYEHFPLETPLAKNDEIFPTFIVNELPTGVSGLVVAAIFAAAMSTLSGSLNSLASVSLNDFYRVYIRPAADERHYLSISRVLTVVWGLALIGVAIMARHWGSVLEVGLTIASFTSGAVLGTFLLAVLTKDTREMSALVGMLAGLGVMLAVHMSGEVAWTWYVFIGTFVTFLVGAIANAIAWHS